jgi:hypothetical protein
MPQEIHENDIGTLFVFDFMDEDEDGNLTPIDLTEAESGYPKARFEKEDGTTFDRTLDLDSEASTATSRRTAAGVVRVTS